MPLHVSFLGERGILGIQLRTFPLLGQHSTIELNSQPHMCHFCLIPETHNGRQKIMVLFSRHVLRKGKLRATWFVHLCLWISRLSVLPTCHFSCQEPKRLFRCQGWCFTPFTRTALAALSLEYY